MTPSPTSSTVVANGPAHPAEDAPRRAAGGTPPPSNLGPLGQLGRWSASRRGTVFLAWLAIVAVLAVFAPSVEHALSGAGWRANGSQSVQVRDLAQKDFGGQASSAIEVVVAADRPVSSPSVQAVVAKAERILAADPRIGRVVARQPGVSISAAGKTAVILGGANADPNTMVRAADDLQVPLRQLSGDGVTVAATGASVLWSDFNTANRTAMLRSEMISWPVTLIILLLAFGSLVAAGLPLLLTLVSLLSAAGLLDLLPHVTPISIWAMNFALMFALALGIDYALFIVVRFRGAHFGRHRHVGESVGETMDTAGKAVLFSGLTVLIALSTVMLVPAPAFQSMAAGIMLSVFFVLLATLTLLPAVLGKLGDKVDALPLKWVHSGEHRSARFGRWGELLWRRPWLFGGVAVAILVLLAAPVIGLRTAIDRLRGTLPPGSLVGGAAAENHDLQVVLAAKTPEVIGLVLLLGFLVLLVALQAPLIAALGVLTSLLATGAAFGVARLIFQNGWLHGLLGFTPQGFLDAWGPVFFFAMIFAISMDYTVFLLSSAKEHYERSGDPKDAMVNGLAHSGRVIFAAAAVMVAVFFTFALSGPLPPKEMGIILGVAVLLDALLVRLLLLPVLLRLTGNAAWWEPKWLKRVLPPVCFAHE